MRVADFDWRRRPLPGRASAGAGSRRGTTKEKVLITAADSSLAMSDVVVTCGLPTGPVGTVRLDPNPSGHVEPGDPLVAYFEVYHLARGSDGEGRFEYETSVRSATPDRRVWLQRWLSPKREGEGLGFTRQDKVLGTVRRQYVSVPLTGLMPGRYRSGDGARRHCWRRAPQLRGVLALGIARNFIARGRARTMSVRGGRIVRGGAETPHASGPAGRCSG
jgi:hypothetical protein